MNVKLPVSEIPVAKCFLKTLFYRGGVSQEHPGYNDFVSSSCKKIVDEIIYKKFNFVKDNLDNELTNGCDDRVFNGPENCSSKRTSAELITYIVWFCKTYNVIWNDSLITSYELDAIKKTALGGALYENGCFESSQTSTINSSPVATTAATNNNIANSNQANSSSNTAGKQPKNKYKQSGSQSKNIINLIGQPGQKVYSQSATGKDYCIIADKIGKNTPNAFVRPLKNSAQQNNANIVYMGTGRNYGECTCWFDDEQDAKNFLAKCQNKFGKDFQNIRLGQRTTDNNGYYLVKTEFGDCAIKAGQMNEELEEAISDTIQDIDLYNEWMCKSIS